MALLAGREHHGADGLRRTMQSRRAYWAEVHAHDREQAEKQRRAEAVWAEHQALLDRIEADRPDDRLARKPATAPRIRAL